ncbi:hypothetical protein PUNSTDRAFT_137951 [Punctularia strigosozonata HHB-11173 SS5]|uniref:Uncharacterized protein n=1 Tax=Punctularia strigosozonata (strain HHB-11173) TaxID=741275 RepID=R7S5Y3_PUNST|nr:uncharacterized protein PUNSTDRAFT_137951 [Punctularia strigosozonata HHB-11173 SS5]EIN05266.1 hypothetical protein PUNSTDRAFT_137951 [Punctularia strigosozonata HHB-11173 SS5]
MQTRLLHAADAKFPENQLGSEHGKAPETPSKENPGNVYPKSDPEPAPAHSIPGTGGSGGESQMRGDQGVPAEKGGLYSD